MYKDIKNRAAYSEPAQSSRHFTPVSVHEAARSVVMRTTSPLSYIGRALARPPKNDCKTELQL